VASARPLTTEPTLRVLVQGEAFDFTGEGLWRRACAFARALDRRGIAFAAVMRNGAAGARFVADWWTRG
jgi:hypothetical protein